MELLPFLLHGTRPLKIHPGSLRRWFSWRRSLLARIRRCRREGDGVELVAGVQGGEVLHLLLQRQAAGPEGRGHAVAQGRAQVHLLRAGREEGLLVADVRAGGRRRGLGWRWSLGLREVGGRRDPQPGAGEQLRAQAGGRRRAVGGDAVGQRGGALLLGALADLAAVAVVGGERQVGVEVALSEVEGPVGVLKDLQQESGTSCWSVFNHCYYDQFYFVLVCSLLIVLRDTIMCLGPDN